MACLTKLLAVVHRKTTNPNHLPQPQLCQGEVVHHMAIPTETLTVMVQEAPDEGVVAEDMAVVTP